MTSSWFIQTFYVVILTVSVQPGARTAEIMTSHGDSELDTTDQHLQGKYAQEVEKDTAQEKQKVPLPCAADEQAMARETRKWGEKSMSAWGKRSSSDEVEDGFLIPERAECNEQATEISDSVLDDSRSVEKRKWGENTMQVWGKRAENQQDHTADKRKWGEKTMSAWGKRKAGALNTEDEQNAIDKRKSWGSNTMQVWGKRVKPRHGGVQTSYGVHDLGELVEDNSQPASNSLHSSKSLPSLLMSSTGDSAKPVGGYWGPKRKWETNVMKVWGKRTPPRVELQ